MIKKRNYKPEIHDAEVIDGLKRELTLGTGQDVKILNVKTGSTIFEIRVTF